MNKVFDVYLAHEDSPSEAHAALTLPAYPYALSDALDQVRLGKDDKLFAEIQHYYRCDFLGPYYIAIQDLYGLNTLAAKLADLDEQQLKKFEGLVMIERARTGCWEDGLLTVGRLYDFAADTDSCSILPAGTMEELGKYYIENRLVPELKHAQEQTLELLDFKQVGRKYHDVGTGVFLRDRSGYVRQNRPVRQAFRELDCVPEKPNYTVLMEVWVPDSPEPRLVSFPAAIPKFDAALDHAPAQSWRCVDCRVPALMDVLSETAALDEVDSAARELAEMDDRMLLTYKALLEIRGVPTLGEALELTQGLDEYLLSPEFTSPTEIAEGNFRTVLDEQEAETLRPFVNMHAYGQKLLERQNTVLTGYGALERRDGQPVQGQMEESTPAIGGMEMEGF